MCPVGKPQPQQVMEFSEARRKLTLATVEKYLETTETLL